MGNNSSEACHKDSFGYKEFSRSDLMSVEVVFMNFVPTLLRTLEPFSALLGILCLCMFLLNDRNPASLPAFMKMSKL